MEDQAINNTNNNNNTSSENNNSRSIISTSSSKGERNNNTSGEAVRSRWTPKPEQILILESIFNSGMVNPPKEETVRIRKLLEKFGAVGDANVFYWFQNRRSRSRRRQRQLQASLAASAATPPPPPLPVSIGPSSLLGGGTASLYDFGHHHPHEQQNGISSTCTTAAAAASSSVTVTCFAPSNTTATISTTFADCGDVYGTFSGQMSIINPTHQIDCPSDTPNLDFQSGIITVFLNGVATQIPDGAFDMKAMFGEEVILVHSSGVPVAFNEFGISLHSLQHGESYFLVPRLT